MSGSTRPSIQSVQRTLIIGVLVGVIVGCAVGAGLVGLYFRQNPPVYSGGAFPDELTNAYQNHYLAMAIDSYIVNQEDDVAFERLKRFNEPAKIRILAERSAAYVAAGRGVEAQLINNMAVTLKGREGWNEDTIRSIVGDLAVQYQSDAGRAQAISTFSAQLLEGQVPDIPVTEEGAPAEQPAEAEAPAATAEEEAAQAGGLPLLRIALFSCLGLIVIGLVVYIVGRRQFQHMRAPTKQQIVWEGEGPAPLKQWTGTFELGHDNYDEFFTIETDDGDFLGESGMGIMESISGTSDPKQVIAFDVGLFDKTDITTLSRVVMTEQAYNDETMRLKIEANPQAEAVVATPGKAFTFETSALRVDAKIDEVETTVGEGGQPYFTKLTVSMDLFLKEGVDLKVGEMDIPEEFQ